MQLSSYTLALLDDIERRIDPETEDAYLSQWNDFWSGTRNELLFQPLRSKCIEPNVPIQSVHINDALDDYELMLDYELGGVSKSLNSANDALGVRANYGTGIMSSLFGAPIYVMPRTTHMLPTTRAFNSTEKMEQLLEKGMPDLEAGFGRKVFEFGEFCREVFEKYPKIKNYVQLYHPDTQGPLDIAELLWGGDMFYEMFDNPEFVHDILGLVSQTYIAFMNRWYDIEPKRDGLSVHWNLMQKGPIMLRTDSGVNLSPAFYQEFSLRYDRMLLEYFGGGCVHFCGRGDHYIDLLAGVPGLNGINMSQPHLNNMDVIFNALARHSVKCVGLNEDAARAFVKTEGRTPGLIHIG